MSLEYKIFDDIELAFVKAWGEVTGLEVLTGGARMLAEPGWRNGFSIVCDYREVAFTDTTVEHVREIAARDKASSPLLDRSRCAVVAPQDVIYGLSRMWEFLSEGSGLTTAVFRTLDEARAWLGLEVDLEALWSGQVSEASIHVEG